MQKFPLYIQLDQMDCGPTCLRMISKYFGKHYTAQTLREKSQISREGVSMLGIAEAAENIGLKSLGVKISLGKLTQDAPLPCILHWGQNHFVVLYKISALRNGLARKTLGKIWGGRKLASSSGNSMENISDGVSNEIDSYSNFNKTVPLFHIADPASGLLSFTEDEFILKWLSGESNTHKEGLVLLLEPTIKFYNEDDEKSGGLHIFQLFQYLWKFRNLVIQLGLGMLVGSGLTLLLPFLTQSVIDVGIGTQNISFIYLVLIAQMVLLFSTTAVDFIRTWILLHISTRLNLAILSEFLSKLMRLPVSFFDVKQFGDIMQRIGDHHRIETFLTGQTLGIIFSFFNLITFGFVLAYYNLLIFFLAFGAALLYSLWVILFLGPRRKLDGKRFDVAAHNQSQIVQLIQGMQDIKLSGAETSKRWEWERTQVKLFKLNIKSLSLSQFQQGGGLFINQSKNILITFIAAKAVIDGQLTLGGLMSVQYILGQFNTPIEQMVLFLQSWQDAQISLERLNEVHELIDEEPEFEERRHSWDDNLDIQLTNLWYTYPGAGNDPVLQNVTITIPHGKTTAIVGTSGSGKTTLLKLLLRFYEPQVGTISLNSSAQNSPDCLAPGEIVKRSPIESELALKNISFKAWRQQCGLVMQDGFIFSDTIARNIAVGDELIDKKRLYKAALVANIHQFIESLPLGYDTKIGAEGNGMSQGQKQRILIARAVYKNPKLILFDEATNSLDAKNESLIVKNLEVFFENKTVVVVAHRLSTVKHADQIIVMEKGKVIEIGTHSDLVSKKEKYFELISNQLELAT